MVQNPKDQLLEIIESLKMPVVLEEAKAHLDKLSDEEVNVLLSLYQEAQEFDDEVNMAAYDANPEEFMKAQKEYEEEIEKLKNERDQRLEKVYLNEAHELDKLDLETQHELKDILYKQQLENNELDEEHKGIYAKLSAILLKAAHVSRPPSPASGVAPVGKKPGPKVY